MTIRIAFDVSILAEHFGGLHAKTGIYRVTEQLLRELLRQPDLEVTATGVCGRDPVAHSILSSLYLEEWSGEDTLDYSHSFASRLGLTSLYQALYRTYFSSSLRAAPKSSARSLAVRAMVKLLRRIQQLDAYPKFPGENFDVLHSPYPGLPSRGLTREVVRVLTVQDLIPVQAPQFVPADHPRYFHGVLKSIDVEHDWVVSASEYTKQELCDHIGIAPERVFVTPWAAADHFRPIQDPEHVAAARRRYGIPEGEYLLSISTFEPRKNLAHLIRCFLRLRAEQPELQSRLVLVGPSSGQYDQLRSAVGTDASSLPDLVFTGYIPDEDLSAIYSGAAAFVYPSLYEGFGLPPLEAMQCGVPVITSNTSSLPEVVGDAALMVAPTDADALCDAMHRVLTDTELRQRLVVDGLERAREFGWTECAARTVAVYRQALRDQP